MNRQPPARALRFAGWTNIALAAGHVLGLIWAYSFFRAVGIEQDMRRLAEQGGAALPYVVTLIVAAGFFVFGSTDCQAPASCAACRCCGPHWSRSPPSTSPRGTLLGGFDAVAAGDGTQIAFAAVALVIGLGYASGAVAHLRTRNADRTRERSAAAA